VRREPTKANRVGLVGGVQRHLALFTNLQVRAVVHRRGGVQTNAGVSVFVVVIGEELFTEDPSVLEAPEAWGKRRAVLQRLEGGFGERVVVAHVGP